MLIEIYLFLFLQSFVIRFIHCGEIVLGTDHIRVYIRGKVMTVLLHFVRLRLFIFCSFYCNFGLFFWMPMPVEWDFPPEGWRELDSRKSISSKNFRLIGRDFNYVFIFKYMYFLCLI